MISWLRTARELWVRFWFEPVEPLNLGVCRVLFFGAFFLFYLPEDFSAWGQVAHSLWLPVWLFETLRVPVLSPEFLGVLQNAWKASLALSCIGLFTRVSAAFSFVLGIYLLGLQHNFGLVHHADTLLVIVLGIMALSRCGDAVSVDRLIRNARRESRAPTDLGPRSSGEYTWPVRAVWLMFALIFFAAGVSKLRHSGLEWIFSDNMTVMLIKAHYLFGSPPSWSLDLAHNGFLTRVMAAATIALEVGYPLALVSRRARWVFVPGVFCLQVGITVLMGPGFYQYLICNLFWIPWDRVVRQVPGGFHVFLARHRGREQKAES